MKNRPVFVPVDGYTQPGYIKAEPYLHGALRFNFRPVTPATRSNWLKGLSASDGEDYDRKTAAVMESRIQDWDFKDLQGKSLEVKKSNLLSLHPAVFAKLERILMGLQATDIDPDWKEEIKDEEADLALQAALGKSREEIDGKNSD